MIWKCMWCGELTEEGKVFCNENCEEQQKDFAIRMKGEWEKIQEERKLRRWKKARIRILHQRIKNYEKKMDEAKQEYWELLKRTNKYETDVFHTYREKDEFVRKLEGRFGIVNWK